MSSVERAERRASERKVPAHKRALKTQLRRLDPARLPAGSYLRLPLLRQALGDSGFRLHARAIDHAWRHERVLGWSMAGFNPFSGCFYYGSRSPLASWLENPFTDARPLNEGDWLTKEVLFLVHDYLHNWAYRVVHSLFPKVGLTEAIGPRTFEDLVFVHLVTEAVATVGLDYWYLSVHDLNRIVDLGGNKTLLTVSYRESDVKEFRRFHPRFEVQRPDFFDLLASFYCTGEFPGFGLDDLRLSPKLTEWLSHELEYGELQRKYIRLWLAYLSGGRVTVSDERAGRPVSCGKRWQRWLMREVGGRLWKKVKEDAWDDVPELPPGRPRWTSRGRERPDFRFVNLNRVRTEGKIRLEGLRWGDDFEHFYHQLLSGYRFDAIPRELLPILNAVREKRDVASLLYLLRDQPRVTGGTAEPWDLLMLN